MIAGAARVLSRHALIHPDHGDRSADRSAHVRAASGLAWQRTPEPRLLLAQDDTSYLVVLDGDARVQRALSLPHSVDGRKIFESRLGNKHHKLDLESCASLPEWAAGPGAVLVVGSGSLPARERMVLVTTRAEPTSSISEDHVEVISLGPLYAALRALSDFSGSELNIEGAAVQGDVLVLANRGNGAAGGDRLPTDALVSIELGPLMAHLRGGPLPPLGTPRALQLGLLDGVRLTLTDLCSTPGGTLFFLAAAEASPNAVDDGEVVGTALGRIDADGVRLVQLRDEHDAPLLAKVEGLVWADPDGAGDEVLVVVDRDDPDRASECLRVRVPPTLLSSG